MIWKVVIPRWAEPIAVRAENITEAVAKATASAAVNCTGIKNAPKAIAAFKKRGYMVTTATYIADEIL